MTSGEDIAAQNFGLDKLPSREQRYEMADEYVELVCKLFDTWDPDAVVMDQATATYADHRKVRPIHFEGKYFKVRGPLNTVRSPQGKPVFVQAGGSPRGRAFAAKHADSIIATANGIEGMKAVSRRRAAPCRVVRAQSGRHQGAVPGLSDPGGDGRGGAGKAAADDLLAALHRARAGEHGNGD